MNVPSYFGGTATITPNTRHHVQCTNDTYAHVQNAQTQVSFVADYM